MCMGMQYGSVYTHDGDSESVCAQKWYGIIILNFVILTRLLVIVLELGKLHNHA